MEQSAKMLSDQAAVIESATDIWELGSALTETARRLVGVSSVCFLPFSGRVSSMADATLFHERHTVDAMAAALIRGLPMTETEFGDGRRSATERLFRSRRPAIDLNAMLEPEGLERKTIFNEFWRPYHIERQLFAPLVAAGQPLGYLCLGRAMSEPQFQARQLRQAAWLGGHATCAIQRLRQSSHGWTNEMLEALRALPMACALFDATPTLLWLSSMAQRVLGLSWAETTYTHILNPTGGLRAWHAAAQRAIESGHSVLHEGDLLLQRMTNEQGDVILVTQTGATRASQQRIERVRALWTLTAREAEVLLELTHGGANKEIAKNLGCSFRTVEVHVASLLHKAGCASRTELLAQLWTWG
jgi:DNA-binding CsgD family transcriptional regulator